MSRIYGNWAGNPKGTKEDTTRCIEEVRSRFAGDFGHQCTRNRGHGPNELYCAAHAKKLYPPTPMNEGK